jgi:hypothetical protein
MDLTAPGIIWAEELLWQAIAKRLLGHVGSPP